MTRAAREFGEGPLSHVTGVVHWFVVVELLLVLTTAPGLAAALLLAPEASNLPLYAASALPVGPALAAAVFAWRRFLTERDTSPARHFLRGYRLGAADALRTWVPALAVLTVLAVNVAYRGTIGLAAAFTPGYVVLGALVLLWAVRTTVVAAVFAFRWRDAARISVLTLVARPLPTLGLLSLLVLCTGIAWVTFDAVVVLLASVLTFCLVRNEQPVLAHVRERFVAEP
ncbi:glycosyl transferase [Kineococcus sp. NUM-3379]